MVRISPDQLPDLSTTDNRKENKSWQENLKSLAPLKPQKQ